MTDEMRVLQRRQADEGIRVKVRHLEFLGDGAQVEQVLDARVAVAYGHVRKELAVDDVGQAPIDPAKKIFQPPRRLGRDPQEDLAPAGDGEVGLK